MTARAGSSLWTSAIWFAANHGDLESLLALLRSPEPLQEADREHLARYLEGSLKAPRGRPRAKATDFLHRSVAPVHDGARFARQYVRVWRTRYGLKNTVVCPITREKKGLVAEACRLAAARLKRISGDDVGTTPEQIREQYRRPKNRRR
jgi:hypothetical protein